MKRFKETNEGRGPGEFVWQESENLPIKKVRFSKDVGHSRADFYEHGCRYRLLGHRVGEAARNEMKMGSK